MLRVNDQLVWDSKPEKKDAPINWVELKTSAEIENHQDEVRFDRKLLKFWVQSFLLGVPKIVVGFRNKQGILGRLEELETQDIPVKMKQRGKGSWDGNVCINFTASFLDCWSFLPLSLVRKFESFWLKQSIFLIDLKATITGEGVWKIIRRDRSPFIEVVKWKESGHSQILSKAFIQWRTRAIPPTNDHT